jgi:competence protein ComEC
VATFLKGWGVVLGLCSAGLLFTLVQSSRRDPPVPLVAWGALLCFLALGAVRLISFATARPDDVRHLVGDERVLATLRGHILTSPYQRREDWCFARFAFTDPTSTFYLKLQQIETDRGWRPVTGTVRVQVDEPTPTLRIGDVVQAYCWLYRFGPPTNPGQFDLAAHLRRRNIYIGVSVPSRDAIQLQHAAKRDLLGRMRARLSGAASHALFPAPAPADPGEGLLAALVLGDRSRIDSQTYDAFRRTGLLHFISLSGLHVGIFAGVVWWLGKTAGLMKRPRAILCLLATALFLMIVPPRAPTMRAAIIVGTFCASVLLRRHANPLNALSLAAIILLLVRPTQLFEVGWQLSFASVAAILVLTNHIEEFIRGRTPGGFPKTMPIARRMTRIIRYAGPGTLRLLSMGIAAWVGGIGIMLYHFYAITPLTSLWTVLVFPLVAALLMMGFFKVLLFFVLPTLSHLLGLLITLGVDLLIGTVRLVARPDLNYVLVGHVALWAIALYYGLVLFALFFPVRRPLLKKRLCIAVSVALIAYLGVLKWQRTYRNHLNMTCLDVGHGQAIVLQPLGRGAVLFDAGSMHRGDVGSRIVLPCLDYMGIGRLDAIVISHNDIDHINGIPEIAARRRVDHVYANPAFFTRADASATADQLVMCLNKRGHTVEPIPRILRAGRTTVETLWPPAESFETAALSDNDKSLVCRVSFDGVSVLLCSDIEAFAQEQIMASYPQMTAQIIVVPHHGSAATRHDAFLPGLRPAVLITSSGRKNSDPAKPMVSDAHAREFSTEANGAVTVCVQTGGVIETDTILQKTPLRLISD